MRTQLVTGLIAVAAATPAVLWSSPAQAFNLKGDNPDLYNHIVNTYIQDERVPVTNASQHQLSNAKATGDSVDIFFVDKEGADALFADRLLYSVNGVTEQAFGGQRVDDNVPDYVADGEGFSVATQMGDLLDFSLWTKGWWDVPENDGIVLGSDASQNIDGKQHIVAYSEIVNGESWLYLGFEDIPDLLEPMAGFGPDDKPDWDYNDSFLAIRGVTMGGEPESVPEPATLLGLLAIAGMGFGLRRRD